MASILSSKSMVFATAIAISSTVILLAFRRPKLSYSTSQFSKIDRNPDSTPQILRSCLSSDEKKNGKKKKRVQFAEDVVDPIGNGEEFRTRHRKSSRFHQVCQPKSRKVQVNQLNRMAGLYDEILRDRVQHMKCLC